MRDIKFRGFWQTVKGNWLYAIGNLSIVDNKEHSGYFISNSYGSPFAYQIIPSTVGQFTGLLDKNRKEIYEGDIIGVEGKAVGEVSQDRFGSWCVCDFDKGLDKKFEDIDFDDENGVIEVIGNIYENRVTSLGVLKELLK